VARTLGFYRGLWVGEAVQLFVGADVARNGSFGWLMDRVFLAMPCMNATAAIATVRCLLRRQLAH